MLAKIKKKASSVRHVHANWQQANEQHAIATSRYCAIYKCATNTKTKPKQRAFDEKKTKPLNSKVLNRI